MSIKLQWVCVFVEKVPFSVRFQSETTGKPTKGDAMRAAFLQGSKNLIISGNNKKEDCRPYPPSPLGLQSCLFIVVFVFSRFLSNSMHYLASHSFEYCLAIPFLSLAIISVFPQYPLQN